jgi:interleukin 12B
VNKKQFWVHAASSPVLYSWCSPVYVVELDWYPDAPGETVVLTCNTPEEDGITWTSDQSNEVLGSGKTLTVQVKEFGDAGRYTCHKGGEVLSHSILLLHKKEDGIWSTDILKDQKGNSIPLDSVIFPFIRYAKIRNHKCKAWLV